MPASITTSGYSSAATGYTSATSGDESDRPRHSRRSSLSIRYEGGMRKINFKSKQKLGIALGDNCDVKGVREESQAYWSGVQKGWKLMAIGSFDKSGNWYMQPVDSTTVKETLLGVVQAGNKFCISFKVPEDQIPKEDFIAQATKKFVVEDKKEEEPPIRNRAVSTGLQDLIDQNADDPGVLSGEKKSMAQRIVEKFEEIDADHNGKIDVAEFTVAVQDLGLGWKEEEIIAFVNEVSGVKKDPVTGEFPKTTVPGTGITLSEFSTVCAAAITADPRAKSYPPPLDMNYVLVNACNSFKAKKKMHSQFGKEFEAIRKSMKLDELLVKQINAKFDEYDTNHDGTIDASEFYEALTGLGVIVKLKDVTKMVKLISNGNSAINIGDFKTVIGAAAEQNREATIDELVKDAMSNYARKVQFQAALGASPTLQPTLVMALQKVADKFKKIDTKKDGKLDSEEITPYLKKLGFHWTKRKVKNFIDTIDQNGDGFIDGQEFKTALYVAMARDPSQSVDSALKATINNLARGAAARAQLKGGQVKLKKAKAPSKSKKIDEDMLDQIAAAFMKADIDGSGTLDSQEFTDLLIDLNLSYRREYVERIFRKIDVNNDRQLSFVELKYVMVNAAVGNSDMEVGELMALVLSSMLNKKPMNSEITEGNFELKSTKPQEPAEEKSG